MALSRQRAETGRLRADQDGKIKAPPPAGRMGLVGLEIFGVWHTGPAGAFARNAKNFNAPSAISVIGEGTLGNDRAGR